MNSVLFYTLYGLIINHQISWFFYFVVYLDCYIREFKSLSSPCNYNINIFDKRCVSLELLYYHLGLWTKCLTHVAHHGYCIDFIGF